MHIMCINWIVDALTVVVISVNACIVRMARSPRSIFLIPFYILDFVGNYVCRKNGDKIIIRDSNDYNR